MGLILINIVIFLFALLEIAGLVLVITIIAHIISEIIRDWRKK